MSHYSAYKFILVVTLFSLYSKYAKICISCQLETTMCVNDSLSGWIMQQHFVSVKVLVYNTHKNIVDPSWFCRLHFPVW